MKFRAYCILLVGNTKDILNEIRKISEDEPRIINGKGLYIATFISASSPSELTEFFTIDNRNFFLFELDNKTSGYNIIDKHLNDGLFGFLAAFKKDVNDMNEKLMEDIRLSSETTSNKFEWKSTSTAVRGKVKEKKITEEDIGKMSKKEREKLFNEMIDNGINNLTENDKKILYFLTKNS